MASRKHTRQDATRPTKARERREKTLAGWREELEVRESATLPSGQG